MKFLKDILAKAGLVVDGVVTLNNTATGQTPASGDSSTNLATTAFVKNQGYLTTITGYVPYTGATANLDLGTNFLSSDYGKFYRGILMSQSGGGMTVTGHTGISASGTNGIVFNTPTQANILSFNSSALRTYTFPDASGTVALTSDLSGYVTLATTQTISGTKTFGSNVSINTGGQADLNIISSTGNYSSINSFVNGVLKSTITTGATEFKLVSAINNILKFQSSTNFIASLIFNNAADYSYTFPAATGTLALASDLSSYVPTSRTLTINGTTYDLSANRSWTITSMIYPSAGIAVSTGTAWGTSITDNSTNWNTAYTNRITSLTTTGTSGPATLISNVLNIPNYAPSPAARNEQTYTATAGQTVFSIAYTVGQLDVYYNGSKLAPSEFTATNGTSFTLATACQLSDIVDAVAYITGAGVGGSGGTNYHAKFTGSTTLGQSLIWDNGTNVGIGNTNTAYTFDVTGTGRFTGLLTGTSATFSASVSASSGVIESGGLNIKGTGGTAYPSMLRLSNAANASFYWDIWRDNTTGKLNFGGASGVPIATFLSIDASTGAATFLSGTNNITLANNFATTGNTNSPKLSFFSFGDIATYAVTGPSIQKVNTGSYGEGRLAFLQHQGVDFTNETEVVSIFSNGNILIQAGGTKTDAGYKLDVNGTGRFTNNANNATLSLLNNNGYPSIINMSVTTATSTARNWAIFSNGTNWGDLEFKPSAANGGDPYTTGTVALRLASTGAATFASSVITNDKITNYSDQGAFRLYNASSVFAGGIGTGAWVEGSTTNNIAIYSANDLRFYTGSSIPAKLTIASTGAATFNGTATNNSEARYSMTIADNSSVASGNGGGVIFQGVYTGTSLVDAAGINTYKLNSTSGDYAYGLNFTTRANGGNLTTRMVINPSGNVGIGTTSPSYKLDVNGTVRTTISSGYNFLADKSTGAAIGISGATGTTNYIVLQGTNVTNPDLQIYTGGAERMRITSGGNVLIGRTTSGLTNGDGVTIGGGSIQPESTGYVMYGNRTTSDGLFIGIRRNNVDVGSITVTTSATAFNTSSDYRLKTDFKEFNGLSIIDSIKTYDYAWKLDSTRAYGVKAHELKQIVPYVVFGEKDEMNEDGTIKPQAVDYSKLTPILIKAVQELSAKNEALIKRIETLENK